MTLPKIYGLIGYPVKHSLSPAMHNAAFKALNINAEYRLFEIPPEKLEEFLSKDIEVKDTEGRICRTTDILGFNVTVPHKVAVCQLLCEKDKDFFVFLSGAVNTVKRDDNRKPRVYNTDTEGFIRALSEDLKFSLVGKSIFIFGCGGAARAVIIALLWVKGPKPRKIYIYDINPIAMQETEKYFNSFDVIRENPIWSFVYNQEDIPRKIKECDLLVNASSLGMKDGDGSVIDKNLLHKNLSVFDVVYNRETQLIKDAKSIGLPAMGGLGMLLYQGVAAFEIWTGQKAPVEVMRKALEEGVGKL